MSNLTSSSSSIFLRQLSVTGNHHSSATSSRRWLGFDSSSSAAVTNTCGDCHLHQMEGLNEIEGGGGQGCGLVMRKRVMVIVNNSSHSRYAMIWALTHAANKGDLLTLLNIVPPPYDRDKASYDHSTSSSSSSSMTVTTHLANSLGSLCKPEVEVDALVIQGPRMAMVMSQVKKIDVFVLGQSHVSKLVHVVVHIRKKLMTLGVDLTDDTIDAI